MSKRIVQSLWMKLQEPRVVTSLQTLIYLLTMGAGISIVFWPPGSVEAVAGQTLSYLWGGFAALGGAIGTYSTPGGKWYLERVAIWLCGTAVIIYLVTLGYLQLVYQGNRSAQMLFIAMAGLSLAIRFVRIRSFDFEPGK